MDFWRGKAGKGNAGLIFCMLFSRVRSLGVLAAASTVLLDSGFLLIWFAIYWSSNDVQ